MGLDYFFITRNIKSSFIDSGNYERNLVSPMGSIVWNDKHSINAGVNLLKIPGMDKVIDKVNVAMYYQYKSPKILFLAGSFPRSEVLGNYNNFFFKDSVNNFVPLMQGVFWQIGSDKNFFNAWFDRTIRNARSTNISSWDYREKHRKDCFLPIFNRICFIIPIPNLQRQTKV